VDRGPVESSEVLSGVTLILAPTTAQQTQLESLLESQRDPSSPEYQHWLTPEEFASRFGASDSDIAKITAWLIGQNLSISEVARGRNFIVVSGAASAVEAAFNTSIHHFDLAGVKHLGNTIAPSVPQALNGVITDIRGLDDFRIAPMHLKMRAVSPNYTTTSGAHYLAPDDVATIYDIAPLLAAGTNGNGQKVAIMGQTDINLSDIQAFRSQFNLPPNTPQVILTGRDPGTSSGDLLEADLDIEWAGAVARNATILYVNSTNVFTSAQYAIDQNLAPVISMSYGGCEEENSSSIRSLAQQAAAQGITWVASAGDSGAAACDSDTSSVATHGLAVNVPASFPEVTAVGGTEFSENSSSDWSSANTANDGSALLYIPEIAWNDTALVHQLDASGGGTSIYYSKPLWQSGAGVPADGARDVPDIAFSASPNHDGYLMYSGGSFYIVGGTSVPTPVFAGVLGLLNQYLLSSGKTQTAGLGNINPTIYHLWQTTTGVFHDVTAGSNIVPCTTGTPNCSTGSFGYSAGAGYDQVTGVGSADINKLFGNWTGSIVSSVSTSTQVTATPSTVAQNASTNLTATVRPASGSTLPTGAVVFTSGSKALGSASLTNGSVTLPVAASALTVGANTITATYAGNTMFTGSSGSTSVSVTDGGTNSAVVPSVSPNPVVGRRASWSFTITLNDESSTPTNLTNFTVNGVSYASSIISFFRTSSIPGNGSIAANLTLTGITPPQNITFGFAGVDPGGHQWSQSITVPFE